MGVSAAAIGAAGNGMEIGAAEAKVPQFAIAESRQFLDLSRPPAARSPGRTKAARPRLQPRQPSTRPRHDWLRASGDELCIIRYIYFRLIHCRFLRTDRADPGLGKDASSWCGAA